jgi:hypothetical protein
MVDVSDSLSPESAAAANIVLKRLLWLRMAAEFKQKVIDKPWSRLEQALKATDLLLQAGGFAAIVLDLSDCSRSTPCVFRWRRGIAFDSRQSRPVPLLSSLPNLHAPAVARLSFCVVSRPVFNLSSVQVQT